MVTKNEAIRIADELIKKRFGRPLRMYHALLQEDSDHMNQDGTVEHYDPPRKVWAIAYETVIMGMVGWDGATIVTVDATTGEIV